jgi:spoIIIJ-associated protein
MSEQERRFFSGNTLQQAIVAAAAHFGIEPGEVAFHKVEKRHGFLKVQRRAVIEVDPQRPRRAPGAGAPEEDAPGADMPGEAAAPGVAPGAPPPPPRRETERPPPERPQADSPAPRRRQPEPSPSPRRDRAERPRRRRPPEERRPTASPSAAGSAEDEGDLVELPERPRPLRERYPAATGPLADAARQALDRILEVAGLEVEAAVLQGEDRLEIDLSGRDNALLTAEEGELLLAIEHLLPRAIRGVAGESVAVRVDCESFHEVREERLRSLAQRVAAEVRRTGQPKKLRPMNPADRRIVHLTVADEPGVKSESEGEGFLKRVEVAPE